MGKSLVRTRFTLIFIKSICSFWGNPLYNYEVMCRVCRCNTGVERPWSTMSQNRGEKSAVFVDELWTKPAVLPARFHRAASLYFTSLRHGLVTLKRVTMFNKK